MSVTSSQIGERIGQMVKEADAANDEMKSRAEQYAQADREYKLKYAQAMASIGRRNATEGKAMTVADRQALADELTIEERYAYKLAEGLYESAKEASRTKRTQIMALQTWVGAWRAEFEASQYGPRTTP